MSHADFSSAEEAIPAAPAAEYAASASVTYVPEPAVAVLEPPVDVASPEVPAPPVAVRWSTFCH